jgi:hypothetical protein
MQKFLQKLDLIVLCLIALVAITLTVYDFFHRGGTPSPYFPLYTLFLLGLIGLHLIVSHLRFERFQNDTNTLLQHIDKGVNAADIRIFSDSGELESYLGKRMLEARKSVCDLSWKAKISEGFSASNRQMAHLHMDKCIAEASERIAYREILIFNDPRRVEKLDRRLSENKNGYSCRYFREDSIIPRLQFVIVDDEEVFFFASSAHAVLCSVRNQELCKVFKAYYEAIWNAAIPIKDGPTIYSDEVAFIKKASHHKDSKATAPRKT